MSYRVDTIVGKVAGIISVPHEKCMNCGCDIFDNGKGFCEKCFKKVKLNNEKICLRCGTAIDGLEDFCGGCSFEDVHFHRAYSAMVYEGSIIQSIYKIKYGGVSIFCGIFANYLVTLAKIFRLHYDVVCYVPMTKAKVQKRGFNQAQVLAEYFCDYVSKRILSHCLKKTKETEQQEKLNQRQRMENVKGAFEVENADEVKGKSVLLIDDVKTTGSTLNECAKMLMKAGAKRVVCLTVASQKPSPPVEEGEKHAPTYKTRPKGTAKKVLKSSKKK